MINLDHLSDQSLEKLLAVMAALRDKTDGCPWDVKQNFQSIAPYTIEEAYEVADAIARDDMMALKSELGDLLLQVVFHSQMGKEAQLFDIQDVITGINKKMIRRHPHVFGTADIKTAEAQTEHWEAIKKSERAALGETDSSALAGIGSGMPEFDRALKLQKRAAAVSFDWPDLAPVFAKLREEVSELEAAASSDDVDHQLEELGDVLFVAVNLARHLKLDPASALRHCNIKFERRFRRMESLAAEQGLALSSLDLAQQDQFWEQAKLEEKLALAQSRKPIARI